jgi:hypothetical protein
MEKINCAYSSDVCEKSDELTHSHANHPMIKKSSDEHQKLRKDQITELDGIYVLKNLIICKFQLN